MKVHEEFTNWAIDQGVKINGIAAHRFEGAGVGLIATQDHQVNSTLLEIPLSALITAHSIPKTIESKLRAKTIHGLLATFLCLDTATTRAAWYAVLPTQSAMEESMPFYYPTSLQSLLPPAAAKLLQNQKAKFFELDWKATNKAYPDISYEYYLHNWLLVNTRTFYFVQPNTPGSNSRGNKGKRAPTPKNRDDCMALNPFADYFNHTAKSTPLHPCADVTFSSTGYTISCQIPIKTGQEVYISYGNHSNDFLLTEYGFILDTNEFDEMSLDDCILPLLSAAQKESLKEEGFLGNYVLDKSTTCHRTQVALRILSLPARKWQRFVSGADDGEADQEKVDGLTVQIFKRYQSDDVAVKLQEIQELTAGMECQRDTLKRRWTQIDALLNTAIERLQIE